MGASQNGHINVIKILLVHHADVNARDLVRALTFPLTLLGHADIICILLGWLDSTDVCY